MNVAQKTPHSSRDGSVATTSSSGVESAGIRDSRDHRHQPTQSHSDCNQYISADRVEARPPSDATASALIASPPLSAIPVTNSIASPHPDSSFTTKQKSTKKKLQLRAKPRRKPQDRRVSTDNQDTPVEAGIVPSAHRSSDRRLTPVTARRCEDVAAIDSWTPPMVSSSQTSLSPRQTSIAETHQRLAAKDDQARCGSSRDRDHSSRDYPADHVPRASSKKSKQMPSSASVSSSNKENEHPSDTRSSPRTASDEGQNQPKRLIGTSLSQIARSARAKHKSVKKVGTTVRLDPTACLHSSTHDPLYACLNRSSSPQIARKKTTKRTSLGGRKKPGASGALLSTTISGAGKVSRGIIDANSISGTSTSSTGAARRPAALVSDWFAGDTFSFD